MLNVGEDARPISLKDTMDAAPIGPLQWFVAVMLTTVMILEGIDFQLSAYSAPVLMKLWHLSKPEFAPLIACTMIGMAFGSLIGSWTGDRYGRKSTLFGSVFFFGVLTAICATATTPRLFMAYRLLAGLGLGAAFPVATAMVSEWMPRRAANKAVGTLAAGIPIGITAGALVGSWILPIFGWRVFFGVVAGVCILIGATLSFWLPESPSYLLLKGRQDAVRTVLARAWGRRAGPEWQIFELGGRQESATGGQLFAKGRARTNIGLWVGYLGSTLATYTISAWLTVVLVEFQLPLAIALRGSIAFSAAATLGVAAVGWLIDRFGSRATMLSVSVIAMLSAILTGMACYWLVPGTPLFAILFPGLAIAGFCIGAAIAANLVLAARVYETDIRARGLGLIYAVGRVAGIISSFIGSFTLEVAHEGGFFMLIAGFAAATILGNLLVDRHIGVRPSTSAPRIGGT